MTSEAAQHAGLGHASRFRFCVRCFRTWWSGSVIKANSIVTQLLFWNSGLVPGIYLHCRARFHFIFDSKYEHNISPEKIINSLIQLRVKLAKKRHDLYYFRGINSEHRNPDSITDDFLKKIFPPRRQWIALGKTPRSRLSPIERNKKILLTMVEAQKNKDLGLQSDWYKCLNKEALSFFSILQNKNQKPLTTPRIYPVPKGGKKNVFRPIASFALEDRLVIGRAGNYIRDKIDPVFLPCSYAFRSKPLVNSQCPTHHDAISDLLSYRQKHAGKKLYVAECDIQKFFDILNHDVIIRSFYKIIQDLKKHDSSAMDCRALQIFKGYLECYTYETGAITGASSYFNEKGLNEARLDKPDEKFLMQFYNDPKKVRYGIPQGGALSPIIANIVLHWADKDVLAVYGDRNREDLFYARYCDDMVIAHPDKAVCDLLLEAYCISLKKLRLLVHEPKIFKKYDEKFYDVKSKRSYPWTAPDKQRLTVPWVSFVGYQVGHDGGLRIRKASIEKEMEKQKKISVQTIRAIKKNGKLTDKSAGEIIYRLKSKLSSMSAGKRYPNSTDPAGGMCWANGFKLLKKHEYPSAQLKQLDRSRDWSISLVKHYTGRLKRKLPNGDPGRVRKAKNFNKYFGHPFSYLGAFVKKEED